MTSSTPASQQTAPPTPELRNTPARVGAWSAGMGAGLVVGLFATPMLWLAYSGLYIFFLFACGAVAIPAGHLGRRRGKRLGGTDRGLALLCIVTGWLLILIGLLLVVVYAGAVIGLGLLVDSVR